MGTSATKGLVVSETGEVIMKASASYPLLLPRPGWTEQRPEDWWEAVKHVSRELLSLGLNADDVKGIGLTGQMHDLVLLGPEGRPLRPALLWNDQRTAPQVEEIKKKVDLDFFIEVTGSVPQTGFTAPKLLWVKEVEPEVYTRARLFLLPKDYVGMRMTGEICTDVNDASGTSLFDVGRRRWSSGLFEQLGLDEGMAPPVKESQEVRGELTGESADELGLRKGTPVAVGAGDAGAGALAAGVVEKGTASVMIGTAGQVVVGSERYVPDHKGRLHTWCQPVPGKWHVIGAILSAGGSLRWFRDALGSEEKAVAELSGQDPYDLLSREAEMAPPGSEGLIFLPYLSGERSPHADPDAKAVFFGLSLRHGKRHMVRAIMEGVAFAFRDSVEAMRDLGLATGPYRFVGGGARSTLWRAIIADVLDATVEVPEVDEGSSYGAAMLAMVAAGAAKDAGSLAEKLVKSGFAVAPDQERVKIYSRTYAIYRSLYPALKDIFKQLA